MMSPGIKRLFDLLDRKDELLVAMTKRAEAAEAREPDWIAMNGDHADYLRVQRSGPDWLVWDTFGQKAGQAICIGSDPDFALAVEAACRFLEKD